MTKTAITAIKQAEEQAEVLCRVAQEKAAEMKKRIEQEGIAHCQRIEQGARAEQKAKLDDIRARTSTLSEKRQKQAESDAAAMIAAAERHMNEAVKKIVWGIVEKCQ